MTQIEEPVFLIHNCVPFADIRVNIQLKDESFEHLTKYNFYQNLIWNSHQCHEYKQQHPNERNIILPCGPRYICKKHNLCYCIICSRNNISNKPQYNQQQWKIEWKCNTHINPHFWIFDSNNGLVMTLMKTVQQ